VYDVVRGTSGEPGGAQLADRAIGVAVMPKCSLRVLCYRARTRAPLIAAPAKLVTYHVTEDPEVEASSAEEDEDFSRLTRDVTDPRRGSVGAS
jgi:hypothetical protein